MRNWPTQLKFIYETEDANDELNVIAAEDVRDGAAVWALAQNAARLNEARPWHANPGGVFFSVVLRIPASHIRAVSLIAVMAAGRVISRVCRDVEFRWPNDLLIDGEKVCGILAEPSEDGAYIVIGMGVNVNNDSFISESEIENVATSIKIATGRESDCEQLATDILAELGLLADSCEAFGFAALRKEYEASCVTIGKTVSHNGKTGLALGVSDDGELIIQE